MMKLSRKAIGAAFGVFALLPFLAYGQALSEYWQNQLAKNDFKKKANSFCLQEDEILRGTYIKEKLKPASVSKLYTTAWALTKKSPHFRYKTTLWVGKDRVHIQGGGDPFFVSEQVIYLLSLLNEQGIESVSKLSFDSRFYLNWSSTKNKLAQILKRHFNTSNWDAGLKGAYNAVKSYVYDNYGYEVKKPDFKIENPPYHNEKPPTDYLFKIVFQSSPFYRLLKETNKFSNNFFFDKLFAELGGSLGFSVYMQETFDVDSSEIFFETGSGLGGNYTSCHLTLKLLQSLKKTLNSLHLSPQDIMPVAGIDGGTLYKRLRSPDVRGSVIAKTGTLPIGRASTLAGYISTDKGLQEFALINTPPCTSCYLQARKMQDNFLSFLSEQWGNFQSINYSAQNFNPLEDHRLQVLEKEKAPVLTGAL